MIHFNNQIELFYWVWEHRAHRSEISGKKLATAPMLYNFAHILPKGSWNKFKLYPPNILLVTFKEHILMDTGTWPEDWEWIRQYKDYLKQKYNGLR